MGLFSFVGKAIKGIGSVVGGAVKLAGSLGIGGPLVGIAGKLLGAKQPMATTQTKMSGLGGAAGAIAVRLLRGNQTQSGFAGPIQRAPPAVLRMSPVMPGGAIATPAGPRAASSPKPPLTYGGSGGAPVRRRKKRTSSRKRSGSRKRTTARRGRKLKFGSAAYRRKYLGHR